MIKPVFNSYRIHHAYGSGKLHHKQVLWLGLAGASLEHFEKRNYDKMLAHQLNVGMANYAGIANSKVEILYDTFDTEQNHMENLLKHAYDLGFHYSQLSGDVVQNERYEQ